MIITDIAVQKHNKNMRSIFIDYKYCLSLEDIDVYKLKLKVNQEITISQIEEYKKLYEYSKAKDKAIRFVSYKKRSMIEVKQKLANLGYIDDVIDQVIQKLFDLNYLDDEDYTQSFIKEKMKLKPCGKKLLRYELKSKGIDDNIIDNSLSNLEFDEYQTAYELADKKYRNIEEFDEKTKRKIYSFLLRKGFTHNIAIDVVNKLR